MLRGVGVVSRKNCIYKEIVASYKILIPNAYSTYFAPPYVYPCISIPVGLSACVQIEVCIGLAHHSCIAKKVLYTVMWVPCEIHTWLRHARQAADGVYGAVSSRPRVDLWRPGTSRGTFEWSQEGNRQPKPPHLKVGAGTDIAVSFPHLTEIRLRR